MNEYNENDYMYINNFNTDIKNIIGYVFDNNSDEIYIDLGDNEDTSIIVKLLNRFDFYLKTVLYGINKLYNVNLFDIDEMETHCINNINRYLKKINIKLYIEEITNLSYQPNNIYQIIKKDKFMDLDNYETFLDYVLIVNYNNCTYNIENLYDIVCTFTLNGKEYFIYFKTC